MILTWDVSRVRIRSKRVVMRTLTGTAVMIPSMFPILRVCLDVTPIRGQLGVTRERRTATVVIGTSRATARRSDGLRHAYQFVATTSRARCLIARTFTIQGNGTGMRFHLARPLRQRRQARQAPDRKST